MPFDRKKYPADWDDISRRILERDNYQCKTCGRGSGLYVLINSNWYLISDKCKSHYEAKGSRVFKMTLACTHLNHDPSDCSDENLATGCVWCHLDYDRSYQQASRKFGKDFRKTQIKLF